MKAKDFIGMTIKDAEKKLGELWMLDWQFISDLAPGADYVFKRKGLGELVLNAKKGRVFGSHFFQEQFLLKPSEKEWDNETGKIEEQ